MFIFLGQRVNLRMLLLLPCIEFPLERYSFQNVTVFNTSVTD